MINKFCWGVSHAMHDDLNSTCKLVRVGSLSSFLIRRQQCHLIAAVLEDESQMWYTTVRPLTTVMSLRFCCLVMLMCTILLVLEAPCVLIWERGTSSQIWTGIIHFQLTGIIHFHLFSVYVHQYVCCSLLCVYGRTSSLMFPLSLNPSTLLALAILSKFRISSKY